MPESLRQSLLADEIPVLEDSSGEPVIAWMEPHRPQVEQLLNDAGIVLLRGFTADSADTAERALAVIGEELLDDAYWSTPRSGVANKTFTATEYPNEKTIALHSEMAYMKAWPRLVGFHSLIAADRGGETTVCNLDDVSADIQDLLPEFHERGVQYRRTYHPGIDIPWQKAFQTDDPAQVRAVAERIAMRADWVGDDILQTVHNAQGCVTTEQGGLLWFSQAHLFHTANLPPATLAMLRDLFGEEYLPRSAYYGDGTAIADGIIHRVNDSFNRFTIKVPWRSGDVLLIDNMRYAHGRMPFEGTRKLHVALANHYDTPARTTLFP